MRKQVESIDFIQYANFVTVMQSRDLSEAKFGIPCQMKMNKIYHWSLFSFSIAFEMDPDKKICGSIFTVIAAKQILLANHQLQNFNASQMFQK